MPQEELNYVIKCVFCILGGIFAVHLIDVLLAFSHVLIQIEGLLMGLRKQLYPYQFEPFGQRIRNWFSNSKRKE